MEGLSLASPQAEEALLTSMLNSHTAVLSVMQRGLQREDFAFDQLGHIYRAMLTIVDQGRTVDQVTVISELEASGKLEIVGGAAVVQRLARLEYDDNMTNEYVGIIKDRAIRRSMKEACEDIMNTLHNDSDLRNVMTSAEEKVFRVSEMMSSGATVGMDGRQLAEMWKTRTVELDILPYFYKTLNKRNQGRRPGSLTLWGGYTSDGKSIAGIQELINYGRTGKSCALYSLEMTEEEVMARVLSQLTGIDPVRIELNDTDFEEGRSIDKAVEQVAGWNISVYADPAITPSDIRARQMRDRVDGVIVDYLQRFDFQEYKEIPRIAKGFKNLALTTRSCVDLLSQLTPSQVGIGQNPFPRPSSQSLYGGKATGHEANNIIFLWPHRKNVEVADVNGVMRKTGEWQRTGSGEIIVEKFRGGQSNWTFPIFFDERHLCWSEVKPPEADPRLQTAMDI